MARRPFHLETVAVTDNIALSFDPSKGTDHPRLNLLTDILLVEGDSLSNILVDDSLEELGNSFKSSIKRCLEV